MKDYGLCDGTLQLDAPLRGGKNVTDDENQSELPDLRLKHFSRLPSLDDRFSPPNSASLPEQLETFADATTARIAVNSPGGDATAESNRPVEPEPEPGSACAVIPLRSKGGGAAPAVAVPIRRGKRGGLAFDEDAMDPQSRRRVVRNRESASESRRRKQVETSRVRNEVCRLRKREAHLKAELTHARARALLAEVRAQAAAQLVVAVSGETAALEADRAALRDALYDARAELAVPPQDCHECAARGAPATG
jgi:hypothetical protein